MKELEVQNNLLNEQLREAKEKQPDIAPFRNQASLLQKELNQILLKLSREMYKVKQIETRLKELANNGTELRKKFFDMAEIL